MDKKHDNAAWFLVLPAILVLGFVGIIPLLTIINFSFFDLFTIQDRYWVGTEWYTEILNSARFVNSFLRSLLFSSVVLLVEIPLGIAIALALPRQGIFVPILLIAISMPLLVPLNLIPSMWTSLLNTNTGILGRFLTNLSLVIDWKFDPIQTWIALIIMDAWHWTSLVVILCYSSLSTIPQPYYQAAAIDGASSWQVFRFVQLPKMSGVLLMAVLLRFVDSFMIYTEAFKFNAGGPHNATLFLAVDLGEEISAFNYGPSAARSVLLFIIVLSVAWAFQTIHRLRQTDGNAA
jgi:glycerol transport system permease protein